MQIQLILTCLQIDEVNFVICKIFYNGGIENMFKDISLYIDNNKVDFQYEIDKDKIIIKTIDELEIGKN